MPPARIDPTKLKELIEVQKLTQIRCAELLGVSKSCVERTCKRLGLQTQRTGPRGGSGHPNWKGEPVDVGGYLHKWVGTDHPMATKRGYVAIHRLKMSEKIGRPLKRSEVVHHIDGNPKNNEIENLMLFRSNSDYLRHELTGKTPNHSPEGKERIREAARRMQKRRRAKALDA